MTEASAPPEPADPGVEASVARPGGVSYLAIPVTAADLSTSARFYEAVFGWHLGGDDDRPSFSDGTGHVIGHWRTDLQIAGESGIRPYIYVDDLDKTLAAAIDHGATMISAPYDQGSLRIAAVQDPAGNVIGVWEES